MASFSTNPWSPSDALTGIQLGTPQAGLVQARRFGLIAEDSLSAKQGVSGSHSLRLVDLLKELAVVHREMDEASVPVVGSLFKYGSQPTDQVEIEILKHLLDKETADLTHVEVLESRLRKVDSLLSHFTAVISSKDQLLERLQSSTAESSLKIEAPFHKYVAELLPSMGAAVTDLSVHSQALQWAQQLDIAQTALEDCSGSGVLSVVQCKAGQQLLHQLQSRTHQS